MRKSIELALDAARNDDQERVIKLLTELLAEPVKQEPVAFQMICPRCKVDRVTTPCPNRGGMGDCPMTITAQNAASAQPVKQEPVVLHKVVLEHIADLRACVPTLRQYPEMESTCNEVVKAADELESALIAAPLDAKAIRAEALEEAAVACDKVSLRFFKDRDDLEQYGADECAAAIRGLK